MMSLSRRSFLTRTATAVAIAPIAAQEVAAALVEAPTVMMGNVAVENAAGQAFTGTWSAGPWMGHGDYDLPPWYRDHIGKLLDSAFTPLEDSPFAPYAGTKEP